MLCIKSSAPSDYKLHMGLRSTRGLSAYLMCISQGSNAKVFKSQQINWLMDIRILITQYVEKSMRAW